MATPTASKPTREQIAAPPALRTPRSAAVAGVIFAVLLMTALVLVRMAVPNNPHRAGTWISNSSNRDSVVVALTLVPFAAIAFLWFIGVVRDRIGEAEDKFFATVFLGSGLLFVAMLLVAASVAGALVAVASSRPGANFSENMWHFGHQVTYIVLTTYAMRMAAVFTISTSTILLRTRALPRWVAFCGYAIAVVLLLTVGFFPWIELLFPLWVLLLSSYILIQGRSRWVSAHT